LSRALYTEARESGNKFGSRAGGRFTMPPVSVLVFADQAGT